MYPSEFATFKLAFNCRLEQTIFVLSEINKMNCELMLTYDTPALRQTGSRNLTGPKTLPTIWGTYMKLVTKYQISAINSCWEKCNEKWAYIYSRYPITWEAFFDPSDSYFLFVEERGYHKWALAHSSSCWLCYRLVYVDPQRMAWM
jgi:hypothetical protein